MDCLNCLGSPSKLCSNTISWYPLAPATPPFSGSLVIPRDAWPLARAASLTLGIFRRISSIATSCHLACFCTQWCLLIEHAGHKADENAEQAVSVRVFVPHKAAGYDCGDLADVSKYKEASCRHMESRKELEVASRDTKGT